MLQNIMSCAVAWLCLPTPAIAQFDPGPFRLSGEYPHQYETGIVLVSFKPDAANEVRERTLTRSGARSWHLVTPHLPHLYRVRVADGDEDRAVERCRADPAVALARRNAARYFFGSRAKAARLTQTIPYNVADSNAPTLWSIAEPGEADGGIRGGRVRIAIIDTGCNAHNDLPTPIAEENFVNLGAPATDSEGHGTAVAGVALARDNEMCYVGAAPAADLVVAKIDPEQGGTTIDRSIAAISWAINVALPDSNENPVASVRVINMSYGSSVYDEDEEFICNKAMADGVVLVAAVGNAADGICTVLTPQYPGAYATVLAVAAVDEAGIRTDQTDSLRHPVADVCAGGVLIPTLSSGGASACGDLQIGTSFASPVVAGVAALLFDQLEADPSTERKAVAAFLVRQALILGASDGVGGFCNDPAGRDPSYGWGRVDAAASHLIVARRYACAADFNIDGVLDAADLSEFLAAANANPPAPGPGGYAVPQSIRRQSISDDVPDAPYDELGYAADFNQDGKLDPDDLADFIAAYFAGC